MVRQGLNERRWLILVVASGAALRLFPIWFGLPYLFARPDEEVATGFARKILTTGNLNPEFFHWPSLTFYVFASLQWIAGVARQLAGLDPEVPVPQHLVVCRAFVALTGAFTMVLVHWLGRRALDAKTGLAGAAVLAVAMLHVRDSHFAMTDILMTMLATGSLTLLARAIDEPVIGRARWWYALAGIAGGLAASTKYNAAAVLVAMAAAQLLLFWRRWRDALSPASWLPSVLFAAAFGLAFLAGTPYAVLDYPKFIFDLRYNFQHLSEGHAGLTLGRGWIYHLTHSLPYGLGPTAIVFAIAGVIPMTRMAPRHAIVLGSFCLGLYASVGSGFTVFFRYVLPLVPIACVFAGAGIWFVAGGLSRVLGISARAGATCALALAVTPGLVNAIWFDVILARTDTRVIAGNWLASRITPDDALYDAGGNYAALDLSDLRFHPWYFDRETQSFGHPEGKNPEWIILPESPVFTYTRVPTAVLNLVTRDYALVKTVPASRSCRAVYDLQDAFFVPVWGFWTVERPGPTVKIYRRRT